jgi:hypothetical protein
LCEFSLQQSHDGVDVFVFHERNGKRLRAKGKQKGVKEKNGNNVFSLMPLALRL